MRHGPAAEPKGATYTAVRVSRDANDGWTAEEAPGAYKDVARVVIVAEGAGLARRVARFEPLVCVKG